MFGLGSYFKSLCYDTVSGLPFLGYRSIRPYAADYFEYRRIREMAIISLEKRYVYVINPKVASTSIRNRLRELNGYPELENPRDIRDYERSGFLLPRHLSNRKLVDIFENPEFFHFCFVRNPFDRLVSGYKFFRDTMADHYGKRRHQRVLQRRCDPRRDIARKRQLSFPEFVEDICLNDQHVIDQHWRPQTSVLKTHLIDYDFIGRIESFAEDLTQVLKRLGADEELLKKTGNVTNASGRKTDLGEWYDEHLADLVRRKYAADFEEFGYPRELPG